MSGQRSVVLVDRDRLVVRAKLRADGTLVIEGQDLRRGEYEYFLTVAADDVPRLATGKADKRTMAARAAADTDPPAR